MASWHHFRPCKAPGAVARDDTCRSDDSATGAVAVSEDCFLAALLHSQNQLNRFENGERLHLSSTFCARAGAGPAVAAAQRRRPERSWRADTPPGAAPDHAPRRISAKEALACSSRISETCVRIRRLGRWFVLCELLWGIEPHTIPKRRAVGVSCLRPIPLGSSVWPMDGRPDPDFEPLRAPHILFARLAYVS